MVASVPSLFQTSSPTSPGLPVYHLPVSPTPAAHYIPPITDTSFPTAMGSIVDNTGQGPLSGQQPALAPHDSFLASIVSRSWSRVLARFQKLRGNANSASSPSSCQPNATATYLKDTVPVLTGGRSFATAVHAGVRGICSDTVTARFRKEYPFIETEDAKLLLANMEILGEYADGLQVLSAALEEAFIEICDRIGDATHASEPAEASASIELAHKAKAQFQLDRPRFVPFVEGLASQMRSVARHAESGHNQEAKELVTALENLAVRADRLVPISSSLTDFVFPPFENPPGTVVDPFQRFGLYLSKKLKHYRATTCVILLILLALLSAACFLFDFPAILHMPILGLALGVFNQLCVVSVDPEPVTDTCWLEMFSRFNLVKAFTDAITAAKPATATATTAAATTLAGNQATKGA